MPQRYWNLYFVVALALAFAPVAKANEANEALSKPSATQPLAAAQVPSAPAPSQSGPPVASRVAKPRSDILADDPILAHQPDAVAPPPEGLGDLVGTFARTMLMLLAVLALVYLTLHKGLGKLTERSQIGKRMRVVERVGLDARRGLYIVEVDGRELLIGTGEQGPVRISELGDLGQSQPPPSTTNFHAALEHVAERETLPAASSEEST
jgi:flagellar biogenesis protein FliO